MFSIYQMVAGVPCLHAKLQAIPLRNKSSSIYRIKAAVERWQMSGIYILVDAI